MKNSILEEIKKAEDEYNRRVEVNTVFFVKCPGGKASGDSDVRQLP
jgi:hypothetical protein